MSPLTNQAERVFDKLEEIRSSVATMAVDLARVQGAQQGMQTSISTVSAAIGDVTETKIVAAAQTVTIAAIAERLAVIERKMNEKDTRTWVESLVKWAVGGLAAGGGIAGVQHFL